MKKRILSILLTLCMVLMLCPVTAFAANDDATELQSLLSGGGTVTLDKDYTIDSTLDVDRTVTLDLNGHVIKMTGSGTVIIIGSQANLTMIDSNNTATHTDSTLPAGGVITGGNATQNGGGIYVGGGCSMTMTGGTIENCSATGGGGVYVFHSGSFTMKDGTIENCSATYGGGVYVAKSTFAMEGGTIENCSAKSGGGGGIYVSSGTFTIGDGEIKNCKSSFGGGGLYIVASGSGGLSTFTMTGGIIENCTSKNVSESAAIFASNSNILANGGIVKGTVVFGSNSAINTTSADSCTKFYNEVTNNGAISGGVYYGGISGSGTVSGTYHTVTFDANGSSSVPTQWFVNTDKEPALQPADPTRDEYQAFDGWYNGDTKYDFTQPVTQDIILTAKFSNPKPYNISYDLDGGTATNPATYTVESDAITLNNPVKTGYTFTGWSGTDLTGENNMTVTIAKGSAGDRAYTAHYTEKNSFIVAFDTNGGSGISDKTGVKWTDKVLDGITNPTKDGFEFTGWKCGDMTVNANTMYSDLAANDTITSVTLVAQWKDIQKPVITGLENGNIYCDAVEFEVCDNDGITSVKANDVELTATDGKYTLAKGVGTVTVIVTDNAGNTAQVCVTVNDGHTAGNDDGNCSTPVYCIYHPDTVVVAAKSHDFSGEWQKNGTDHWHICQNDGCTVAETETPHSCTDDGDCTTAVVCECGYVITAANAKHTYGEWQSNSDDTHTRYCTVEGCNGYEDGNCAGGEATCVAKAVCDTCKAEYGEIDSANHNLEKIPAKDATVTETGNTEYWHCQDCGKYFADENGTKEIKLEDTIISKLSPEIIEGKGQSITAGEKKELIFKSNAAFSDFIRVELDGKTLDEKYNTVKEGSTVVTLKADYVATLSVGEHTIGIVSTNGTATTTFTVKAKTAVDNDTDSPQTGDNSRMVLWIALLAASVFGLAGTAVYSKRKRVR